MNFENTEILEKIKQAVKDVEPQAEVVLFGSRARRDEQAHSDWDILILAPHAQEVRQVLLRSLKTPPITNITFPHLILPLLPLPSPLLTPYPPHRARVHPSAPIYSRPPAFVPQLKPHLRFPFSGLRSPFPKTQHLPAGRQGPNPNSPFTFSTLYLFHPLPFPFHPTYPTSQLPSYDWYKYKYRQQYAGLRSPSPRRSSPGCAS